MNDFTNVISIGTEEAGLYFDDLPNLFVPNVGEDIFVPGPGLGWWTVKERSFQVPNKQALTPSWIVNLLVEWSDQNNRPAPIYDEDWGWVQQDERKE